MARNDNHQYLSGKKYDQMWAAKRVEKLLLEVVVMVQIRWKVSKFYDDLGAGLLWICNMQGLKDSGK